MSSSLTAITNAMSGLWMTINTIHIDYLLLAVRLALRWETVLSAACAPSDTPISEHLKVPVPGIPLSGIQVDKGAATSGPDLVRMLLERHCSSARWCTKVSPPMGAA